MERLSEMKKKKKNLTVVNLFNIDSVYRPGRTNLALSRLHRWWAGMRVLHLCDTVHQKSAPLFSFLVAFQNSHVSLENPFLLLYHDVHFNVFFTSLCMRNSFYLGRWFEEIYIFIAYSIYIYTHVYMIFILFTLSSFFFKNYCVWT